MNHIKAQILKYGFILIKIDRDFKSPYKNRGFENRMKLMGKIVSKKKTRNGYHWIIKITDYNILKNFGDNYYIFELRYWLGDDPARIVKDIFKYNHGYELSADILFDKKWRGW